MARKKANDFMNDEADNQESETTTEKLEDGADNGLPVLDLSGNETETLKDADLSSLQAYDPDQVLNELKQDADAEDVEAQRLQDEIADFMDSPAGKLLAAKQQALVKKAISAAQKGLVLADGSVQNKVAKPAIDPERVYANFPIRTIDGEPVKFISSRPFYDKLVKWDDGFRQNSSHFQQSEHPNYCNAVYCRIKIQNFDKTIKDGFVVRTDEEIQLFYIDK